MTYRDESDALRARVEALETQLAEANQRIAELSGTAAPVPTSEPNGLWIAAPTKLVLEREFDLKITPELTDRLTNVFRERFPMGQPLSGERSFSFRQGTLMATLSPIASGRARLRVSIDHSALGIMPPFIALMIGLCSMVVLGPTAGPLAVLIGLPILTVLSFLLLRKTWGLRVHRYRKDIAAIFEKAAAVVASATPGVRIGPIPEDVSVIEPIESEPPAEARRVR